MARATLHIQIGAEAVGDERARPAIANDNVEREQELFEHAASRENTGEDD